MNCVIWYFISYTERNAQCVTFIDGFSLPTRICLLIDKFQFINESLKMVDNFGNGLERQLRRRNWNQFCLLFHISVYAIKAGT